MKKILAVSGGVDSMVMLYQLRNDPDAIVAHFDHGIRENSADDRLFVASVAKSYNLPFVAESAALGAHCSEATARQNRYAFLEKLCRQYDGKIYTAHHLDDLVETVAINFIRGTGWRGLAPMRNPKIVRPLIFCSKSELYHYASQHSLTFRLDSSNTDSRFLRNRVREYLFRLTPSQRKNIELKVAALYRQQCLLASEIEQTLNSLVPQSQPYSKSLVTLSDDSVAIEILRHIFTNHAIALTRPQLINCLTAIRTYSCGKRFSLDSFHFLKIGRNYFAITPP